MKIIVTDLNGEVVDKINTNPITIKYYVLLSDKGIETNNYCETILTECIKPATKKERDLLFTKLKETGYEWEESKLMLSNLKESDIEEENDWMKNLNAVLSYIKDEDLKGWLKKQLKKL